MKQTKFKRIVVKVGTSLITTGENKLSKARIKDLTSQIAGLRDNGIEVLLVTSGAIAAGMRVLKIKHRPQSLPKLQACAAVGQGQLMKIYAEAFKKKGYAAAQLLLTQDDLAYRDRYLNAKNTLFTLLDEGVVPVINENDTVSTDEIKFGDNDRLSSLVANLVKADLLVLLSDVDGLLRCDSAGRMTKECVREVYKVTDDIKKLAAKTKSSQGTGGMASKIEAARLCIDSGISCIVANGKTKDILLKIVKGEKVGTTFLAGASKKTAKKHWIAYSSKVKGAITVDDGAKAALIVKKKSLLASGITGCHGNFEKASVISIVDRGNKEFARGVCSYSSSDLKKIKGLKTSEIRGVLGRKGADEIVHRDNLAIL